MKYKFEVLSSQLLEKLKLIEQFTDPNPIVSILSHVLFTLKGKHMILTATNQQLTAHAFIKSNTEYEPLSVTMPCDRLVRLLSTMPTTKVVFEIEKVKTSAKLEIFQYNIVMKAGKGRYKMIGDPGDEFPLPKETDLSDIGSTDASLFHRLLEKTVINLSPSSSENDAIIPLTRLRLLFGEKKLTGRSCKTSGSRLSEITIPFQGHPEQFRAVNLPQRKINLLVKALAGEYNKIKIQENEKTLVFTGVNIKINATKCASDTYPDDVINSFFTYSGKAHCTVHKHALMTMLKRVSVFEDKIATTFKMTLAKDSLVFEVANNGTGETAIESIPCKDSAGEYTGNFSFLNCRTIFGSIDAEEIEIIFTGPGRQVYLNPGVQTKDFVHKCLTMPYTTIARPENKKKKEKPAVKDPITIT